MNADMQEALRRLETLRREYREKLVVQIEAITSAWEQAKTLANAMSRIEMIRQSAHKIAGTAGTLGMTDTAHAASKLEIALELCASTEALSKHQNEIDLLVKNLSRTM